MRSLLFVPADGGSKLDKAMASGADAVIIDLEDSITPERKQNARVAALEFLQAQHAAKQPLGRGADHTEAQPGMQAPRGAQHPGQIGISLEMPT